jgi:predicted transposase/invertase (TIGR01784 family)
MIYIQFREDEDIPDLCLDAVFKAIMTQETPPSRGARNSLLSAIIDKPVRVLTVTTNEAPISGIHDRRIRFDLNIRLESGELANVEITKDPGPYEVLRMEYYLGRLHVGQKISGNNLGYRDLKKTWHISLLANRNLFHDENLIHRFIYYDREHDIDLAGRTEIITVELKKADKAEAKGVVGMSLQEWWAYFIRHGADKRKRRLINEILAAEEGIAMAGQVVQGFTKHELELFHQISKDKWKTDMQSKLIYETEKARKQGRKQGQKQGREEGKKEGREEGREEGLAEGIQVGVEKAYREKLESARVLKAKGVPVDTIAESLHLSPETVEGLEPSL